MYILICNLYLCSIKVLSLSLSLSLFCSTRYPLITPLTLSLFEDMAMNYGTVIINKKG